MEHRNTMCFTLAVMLSATFIHGATAQWKGTVRDSAGITIVSNTELGSWDSSTRWYIEEELRIGVAEGDPDYQFGRIGWITIGSDHLRPRSTGATRESLSPDGQYLNTLGGPGAGPASWARPWSSLWPDQVTHCSYRTWQIEGSTCLLLMVR